MTTLTHAEAHQYLAGLDEIDKILTGAREKHTGNPVEDLLIVAAMSAAGVQILIDTVRRLVLAVEES